MDILATFASPILSGIFGWVDEQSVSAEEQAALDQQSDLYKSNLAAQLAAQEQAQQAQVQLMLIAALALVAAVWIYSSQGGGKG